MRRREFIVFLWGSVIVRPFSAMAEQSGRLPRIGLLGEATSWEPLRQSLRNLGYVEGRTITLESREAEGRSERWPDLAAELVRLNVDIIVTWGTPATLAARKETGTIPIVMVGIGAPLQTGLISSLSRPGGNVTGLSQLGAELAPKRLELLKEILPNLSRVAFLWNPENPDQEFHWQEVRAGAHRLGLTVQSVEVRNRDELQGAFANLMRELPSALLMTADRVHQREVDRIIAFAAANRLPAIYQLHENVLRGGLISYGADFPELVRRAGVYIDKILKGAKPADLPVEQPTKFDLAVNLKTAKALGLTVPPSLLARADEVIE